MYLTTLHLRSFRNYLEQRVHFQAQKTIILGNNAQGKSNLLEAVELLATLKSHRSFKDRDLVLKGANLAQVSATIKRLYNQHELSILFRVSGRRTLELNQEILRRQIDFLGTLNAVQFSSNDLDLVRGTPEYRRHWLDLLLVQLEPLYSYILHQYQQVLKQRNALLKQHKEHTYSDFSSELPSSLQLWDQQLAETGSRVTRRRARVIERLAPLAEAWHNQITSNSERLEIKYAPNVTCAYDQPQQVQQAFLDKLEQRRIPEFQLGTTVVGPHRDDLEFSINQTSAKFYGSQGQQRTLVLSLKLAELQLIEEVIGEPPLLLLDDVLAELDPTRQSQLLQVIQERYQTLITTTHLASFAEPWLKNAQILTVKEGKID